MPAKKVVSLVSFASWLGALLAELRSEVISSGGKKALERESESSKYHPILPLALHSMGPY